MSAVNRSERPPRSRIRSLEPARSAVDAEIAPEPKPPARQEPPPRKAKSMPASVRPRRAPKPKAKQVPPPRERSAKATKPAPPGPEPAAEPFRPLDTGDAHWCAIVLARGEREEQFQVVAIDRGGGRRVVEHSPFRVPVWCRALQLRQIPYLAQARREHDALVARLSAAGWRQVPTRGRWHDAAFVRG
jgi:hypothetical protein